MVLPSALTAYRIFRNSMLAVLAAALLAGAVAIETHAFDPNRSDHRTSPVLLVSDGSVVPDAFSKLTRTNGGADVTFNTSGLPAGHVVILKAVIFNQPRNCRHGVGGLRCGEDDLTDPEVRGSVVFLTGVLIRPAATAFKFAGQVATNDKSQALVGDGLTNPHGADVHFVVVDHGPLAPGLYSEMISTLGGGCKDAPPGSGTPGPNTCADIQVSAHEQ